MINKIKENVWQLGFEQFGSTAYLLKLDRKNVLIDTSSRQTRNELLENLKELNLNPKKIDVVLLTHNHFDHVENIELFKNAKIYGSKKDFSDEKIKDIRGQPFYELRIIETPGHTPGEICLFMPKEKILFSGDVIFHNNEIGRTDFPNSSPKDMEESLEKLKEIDFDILCPGHID